MNVKNLQPVFVNGFDKQSLSLFMQAAIYDVSSFFEDDSADSETLSALRDEVGQKWANMSEFIFSAINLVFSSDLPMLNSLDMNEHDLIYYLDAQKLPSPAELKLIKDLLLSNIYKQIIFSFYDKYKDSKELNTILAINEQIYTVISSYNLFVLCYIYKDQEGEHCIMSDDIYDKSLLEYARLIKSYTQDFNDKTLAPSKKRIISQKAKLSKIISGRYYE